MFLVQLVSSGRTCSLTFQINGLANPWIVIKTPVFHGLSTKAQHYRHTEKCAIRRFFDVSVATICLSIATFSIVINAQYAFQ